jgi:hypothetical protein
MRIFLDVLSEFGDLDNGVLARCVSFGDSKDLSEAAFLVESILNNLMINK